MTTNRILFFTDDVAYNLTLQEERERWLCNMAQEEGYSIEGINCILMSDEALLQMNKDHLGHDYFTDIITFDYTVGDQLSGELYISTDRVMENAKINDESIENELDRVFCHGVLHMMGYNDKTEAEQQEMRAKEDYYLNLRPFVPRET